MDSINSKSSTYKRRFLLVSAIAFCLIAWFTAQGSDLFDGYDPPFSDIKNDWIVAKALINGDNPYGDLHELSSVYADESYEPPGNHGTNSELVRTPRTPGAVLLAIPWTLLPISEVTQWNNLLAVLLVVPIVGILIWNRADPMWVMVSLAIAFSAPFLWNLKFSNVSMIVAAFMAVYLVTGQRRDSVWSGVGLAIATTMKVFPGILFIYAVLTGRRKTAIWGFTVLAVLNVLPLALPAVDPIEALSAITGATANFASSDFNLSLGYRIGSEFGVPILAALTVITQGLLIVWIANRSRTFEIDSLLLVGTAVLLVPISWPHYALLTLPFAILIATQPDTTVAAKATIAVGAFFMLPSTNPWLVQIGVLAFVLAAIVERVQEPSIPPPQPLSAPASAR